ncbi:extracellular solute-binding protein [Paenibacillus lutimineralis]|uniref:Extracellular solute-binding protein n=1 Tax=Paenibacillus lutimineralis TaxID=2707005 RepID=A0A3S9USW2_9BACL|nr:extracellular solute-binding protein [Paenibacillus lutimineralis]AZS13415.1 extracellular solute-binding protein [Paenibacillus lutimineralis]
MKFKKLTMLVVILLLVFMTACSSSKDNNAATNKNTSTAPGPDKVEEKYKITGATYIFGNPPPSGGRGQQMLNEKFNVDYFAEKIPSENFVEKITAMVAGGNMPDQISFRAANIELFNRWAKQQAFLPLNEYIQEFDYLKEIPDELWLPFTVGGKIYGIPTWSPVESQSFIVRKDWLDHLGLPVPTSYEELKQVAIAFTKNDPDGNSKNDTYGLAIGQDINPSYAMGPYWQNDTWYHKDADGNFIPGMISEGRKELIQFFADLYKEKALTSDFAVVNWADTNNEFYSSKAGVFLIAVRGMSQDYMDALQKIDPSAEFVVLEPFEATDGSKGLTAGPGYSRFLALNAKLADDPDKVRKMLEIHGFSRQYYPTSTTTSANEDFDWYYGNEGVGYKLDENNVRVPLTEPGSGTEPFLYFIDSTAWVGAEDDAEFPLAYTNSKLREATQQLVDINKSYKLYYPPSVGIISAAETESGAELNTYLINEQTKMITGNRSIDEWDAMVQEYLKRGGSKIIEEYNTVIKERGYTEHIWK